MSWWNWTDFFETVGVIAAWEAMGYLLRRLRGVRRIEIPRKSKDWAINPVTGKRTEKKD